MVEKVGIYQDPRKKHPWVCRWFGLPDPVTGKSRRYSKSFRLKGQAERFAAQKRSQFDNGEPREGIRRTTLRDFCDDWLEINRRELGPETVRLYENTIRRLLDRFGPGQTLDRITPMEAEKFLAQSKPFTGSKPLSNWTRDRIRRNCRTMFAEAVDLQYLRDNPFSPECRRKRRRKGQKRVVQKWHRLTPAEYRALCQAAPSLRWECLYAMAYTAGLRRGELATLRWADVDFDRGQVTIQNRKETAKDPPFTIKDKDSRTIPLPKHTLALLLELRNAKGQGVFRNPYALLTERECEGVRRRWSECREAGQRWSSRRAVNNWLTNFRRHVKKAGIVADGRLALHDLRKSCIQNWADILPMNVTQELAGHADPQTTAEFYSLVDEDHRRKAAEGIDRLIRETDAGLTPKAEFGS